MIAYPNRIEKFPLCSTLFSCILLSIVLKGTAYKSEIKSCFLMGFCWIQVQTGLLEAELQSEVTQAGFENFEVTWRGDIYRDAPQASDAIAFGANGITYRAIMK
jgi:hypothetical protein